MTNKLGIYIHIPFCNGKCAYCDFVSGVYSDETQEAYFSMLSAEIDSFDFSGFTPDTVYFGGGTPSSVDAKYIGRLMSLITRKTSLASENEITIECNPESFSAAAAKAYAAFGINRISLGVQTSNDALLKRIGRLHDRGGFVRAATVAAKYFDNINVDLMLGLPGQTETDVRDAAAEVLPFARHVSVYSLKVEDGTPLQKSGYLPDEDTSAAFYDIACDLLTAHGLKRYEVSNFALPGCESRHNKKYWALDDYIGFGAAAHSYINGERTENTSDINAYLRGETTVNSQKIIRGSYEDMEEYVMLALRTSSGIDLNAFASRFGFRLERRKEREIKSMDGLIKISNGKLRLTNKGFYLMNGIILKLI